MGIRYILFLLAISLSCSPALARQSAKPDFNAELAKATTDSQKLVIYTDIYNFYKSKAADSAKPYIEKGLQSFTETGYKYGQANLLLLLSNMYNEGGFLVIARENGIQALKIFTELKDDQHIGRAHTTIGNAESYLGNYTEAIKHFLAALKNFEHISDTGGLVNTYLELGAANDFNGNHEKALSYYRKGLDLSLHATETSRIVYIYNNIGLFYARKGNFDTALQYFEKAELISRNPEYTKTRMHPLTNLGKVYHAMGNDKKALEYLYKARDLSKSLDTKEPLCRVLLEIGSIESGHTPSNTAALQEGLRIAREIDSKRLQAEFLSALAAVAEKTGNYKEEVALLKESRILRDSIFNIDKAKEIANLQALYELKRTSSQLAALERSEHRNAQKKNAIIVIAVVLALTLLTLSIFYTRSRRLNKELSVREQDLKQANSVKDRLFSIIGHDLKGPVGNIPGLLKLYRDGNLTGEEKTYILNAMEESSEASLETLEKLLNWGKQQIKGNVYNPTELDAHAIVNEKLKLLGAATVNKNITIVNIVPPGTRIYADENHFKFIMRNLVSNAVKFTDTGGKIEINATHQPGEDYITFSVKDNGIGIDEDALPHIFEVYNESIKGTANETGTSIGLMLCKEFIVQNGGKIWAESEKGEGATFYFTVKSLPAST